MALDEHAKLISPWYGPVTIFKDIGQNKYIIIDDNTNPEEMEVDAGKVLSPVAIQPEIREEADIPRIIPISSQIANPDDVQLEAMDVEIPSEKHKRTHKGQIQCIQGRVPVFSIQSAAQKPDWEW
jgi:hypothetical protein